MFLYEILDFVFWIGVRYERKMLMSQKNRYFLADDEHKAFMLKQCTLIYFHFDTGIRLVSLWALFCCPLYYNCCSLNISLQNKAF